MKRLSIIVFLFLAFYQNVEAQKCQHSSEVKALYKQLEANGFDTKQKINYQYFFIDDNSQDLSNLKQTLLQQNFRFVNLSKTGGKNQLQVEKFESHSAETMLSLGKELSLLAKNHQVETFDGFEIKVEEEAPEAENFTKEVERIPQNILFKKGMEYYEKEENEKALLVFDRCIRLGINTETATYKRANCKTSLGRIKEAIADFENIISKNPNHFEATFNIAGLYFEQKNYQKAITFYDKATKLNPANDDAFYRLAESYFKTENRNLALKNCQKSLQINPNNQFAKELIRKL